jgi:hypothetical protein
MRKQALSRIGDDRMPDISAASGLLLLFASFVWMPSHAADEQICKPASVPATAPSERYIVNADGTVSDTRTGLMWKRCSEGQDGPECAEGEPALFNWKAALDHVQEVNRDGGFAGYRDWRAPNIREMFEIVEYRCVHPSVNLEVFPNAWAVAYWSSTPYPGADNPDRAWHLFFESGVADQSFKEDGNYLRLVRGGR